MCRLTEPSFSSHPSNNNNNKYHYMPSSSIWNAPWMARIPDPTRMFSLFVIAFMCVRYAQEHDWKWSLLCKGFFGHPCVLVTSASVAIVYTLGSRHSLAWSQRPQYERWAAEWYAWNAWLFHAVMDGGSGTFQWVPVVVYQYDILDKRFTTHHVVPWTIGWIEFFCHYPLCLLTMYGILQNKGWRYPMECITSSFHLMGAIAFLLGEVYEGQHNVPAVDPVGDNGLKFNLYHLTYYWFGFWFCNGVWVVVPILRMIRACKEVSKVMESQIKQE
jgi:hypothetical protein